MSQGRELRIYRDTLLIHMARILTKEFGHEALDKLVEWQQEKTRKQWREKAKTCGCAGPDYLFCLFSKDAHEFEVIRKNEQVLEVKVTKCVHADVFAEHNACDLGQKLICSGDHAVVEGFNPKMKLSRPKVLMAGDDCCYFKFELQKENES